MSLCTVYGKYNNDHLDLLFCTQVYVTDLPKTLKNCCVYKKKKYLLPTLPNKRLPVLWNLVEAVGSHIDVSIIQSHKKDYSKAW